MSNAIKRADKNTIEIMILLTEKCNLSCRYCYEYHKTKRRMTLEAACKILDKEFEAVKGTDKKIVI